MKAPLKPIVMFSGEDAEVGPYGLYLLDIYERYAKFPLRIVAPDNGRHWHIVIYDADNEIVGSTLVLKGKEDTDIEAAKQYYMDMCNLWVEEKGSD